MALGDTLDKRPQADVLLIEANGIAEPRNIAEAAKAEPKLRYGGIVTAIDAKNYLVTQADHLISPQIGDQVRAADLLVLINSSGSEVTSLASAQ